jgi:hypothetical protein
MLTAGFDSLSLSLRKPSPTFDVGYSQMYTVQKVQLPYNGTVFPHIYFFAFLSGDLLLIL